MSPSEWTGIVVAALVAAAVGIGLVLRALDKGPPPPPPSGRRGDIPVRRTSENPFTRGLNGPREDADEAPGPGGPP